MFEKLKKHGVKENLIVEVKKFRQYYKVNSEVLNRVEPPKRFYYGIKVWEECIYALLNGQNILLVGDKATGKNLLSDNLSYIFGRPRWTVSFHNFLDADDLIGMDTYKNGQIAFRNGPITDCSIYGGFCILDEINMAKNDSISVLHSVLDYRRIIDVPGYKKIDIAEQTRFIGTMNYGYFGTKELNEALVSRFAVIQMPQSDKEIIREIIKDTFDGMDLEHINLFVDLFEDLQLKAKNGQISSIAVDLRGIIDAISLLYKGMNIQDALNICVSNKVFDNYERQIVNDLINLKIPKNLLIK